MRILPHSPNGLSLLCVLFLGAALGAHLRAETIPGKAEVRDLRGKASWSTNGGAAIDISIGDQLPPGATLKTGPRATVVLFLGRSVGIVRVGENTTLGLDKMTFTDTGADRLVEVQLNVPEGEMYFDVNKLSAGSRYEIKTPQGVGGIRGTSGGVLVPPPGGKEPFRIVLLEGTFVFVHVPTAGGNHVPYTMTAPPAAMWDAQNGITPAPPIIIQQTQSLIQEASKHAGLSAQQFQNPLAPDPLRPEIFIPPTTEQKMSENAPAARR